jgi:PleD family two-component response regulator
MDQLAPARIVAVVRDLFFAIRIRETLAPRGYTVAVAKTNDALDEALAAGPVALVIVDLAFAAIEPAALIARLKGDAASAALPILAFGSHLDHAARDAAKAAGADRVVANSKLAEALPDLVARYARPAAPTPTEG